MGLKQIQTSFEQSPEGSPEKKVLQLFMTEPDIKLHEGKYVRVYKHPELLKEYLLAIKAKIDSLIISHESQSNIEKTALKVYHDTATILYQKYGMPIDGSIIPQG